MKFEDYYLMRENQEKILENNMDTVEKQKYRSVKVTEIVNEYHYNFVSWRDYDIKKYKERFFVMLYLITALAFIYLIINSFVVFFWKDGLFSLDIPSISTIILMLTSCACLILVYTSIKKDHKDLVIQRFYYFLDESPDIKESKSSILSFLRIYIIKDNNIRTIKEKWLEATVLNENRLEFAKELESWKTIYKSSIETRKFNIFSMIVNRNSLVRILSLVIALFSLIAVLIAKIVEPNLVIENIESNFTILYKQFLKLGVMLLILGYEIYYIFPDIKSSLLDYIKDFSKNKEIYVESRFNRFVNFVLLNHSYQTNSSNLKLKLNENLDED